MVELNSNFSNFMLEQSPEDNNRQFEEYERRIAALEKSLEASGYKPKIQTNEFGLPIDRNDGFVAGSEDDKRLARLNERLDRIERFKSGEALDQEPSVTLLKSQNKIFNQDIESQPSLTNAVYKIHENTTAYKLDKLGKRLESLESNPDMGANEEIARSQETKTASPGFLEGYKTALADMLEKTADPKKNMSKETKEVIVAQVNELLAGKVSEAKSVSAEKATEAMLSAEERIKRATASIMEQAAASGDPVHQNAIVNSANGILASVAKFEEMRRTEATKEVAQVKDNNKNDPTFDRLWASIGGSKTTTELTSRELSIIEAMRRGRLPLLSSDVEVTSGTRALNQAGAPIMGTQQKTHLG